MKDIETLKKQIVAANTAYRDGHPTMSDQAFDDLCDELEDLVPEDEYGMFRDSLHESKGKVKHPFIMGSLNKIKAENPDDMRKFIKDCVTACLNVSAKVDGISARAHYEDGKLVSLTTRGDGSYGENLTDKMNFVKSLPQEIKCRDVLDIRGELVILKDDFEELNEKNGGKFANARNACAGIMNRKDWSKDDVSYVSFVAYTVLGQKYGKADQFSFLDSNGFTCAWSKNFTKDEFSNELFADELVKYSSQDFAYETDGLVLSDSQYKNEEKYRPVAQIAFKLNQLAAETRLVDVSWEGPSKDGFMLGVGIIDPVELGGSVISRVTLHNLDFIKQLGLMYGSKVQITKRGDIIPHIDRVIENGSGCSEIDPPAECPCCGSTLVRDGVNMRCINKDCPEQVVHRLVNFIKKLGVKSASNATLMNFGVTSFDKLIAFTPNKKYKSEVKLYDELYAKVFSQSRERLLCAMNFVGLSETLIDKILSHYGYDFVASSNFSKEAFKSLPAGIGEITLAKFIEDLPDALRNVSLVVNDTRWHWTPDEQKASSTTSALKGSICVTGSLKFGSRSKFLEFAREHGYESKSGVSKGLTYLITNDTESGSSKNRKARELGVKVISEDDFMKLVNDTSVEESIESL